MSSCHGAGEENGMIRRGRRAEWLGVMPSLSLSGRGRFVVIRAACRGVSSKPRLEEGRL